MKTNLFTQKILLVLTMAVMLLTSLMLVYGASDVFPSQPFSMTYWSNSTNAYPNGTNISYPRGFIYTVNVYEKQPSLKWIGFVGNVTGKFALQDSTGFALYDWSITTITGEIYAHRFPNYVPNWDNMQCAPASNISYEEKFFNHSTQYGATADEDSVARTFTSNGANFTPFYVGLTSYIQPSTACYGMNLNINDTHTIYNMTNVWPEVALLDTANPMENDANEPRGLRYSAHVVYASRLMNRSLGYRNDSATRYDFQIMLPMSGIQGVAAIHYPYYFFVELI